MLHGALTAVRLIRHLSLAILQILLLIQVIIVVVAIGAVGLLAAATKSRLAAKIIVLWDYILSSHAGVFVFSELLDVQADLLRQKLRQLLVDAVPPGEIGGQFVRAVSLVDVNVLVLSISNLNRDGQELLVALLALRHFSLSGLLQLREALAELRRLVCVRHVALLRRHARVGALGGAVHHLGRRHLVNRRKPLREIRILIV